MIRPPYDPGSERQCGQEHHILADRQAEEIADYFREWRHRDQSLVIDDAFVPLRGHPPGDLGCADYEEDEGLQQEQGKEEAAGDLLTDLRLANAESVRKPCKESR